MPIPKATLHDNGNGPNGCVPTFFESISVRTSPILLSSLSYSRSVIKHTPVEHVPTIRKANSSNSARLISLGCCSSNFCWNDSHWTSQSTRKAWTASSSWMRVSGAGRDRWLSPRLSQCRRVGLFCDDGPYLSCEILGGWRISRTTGGTPGGAGGSLDYERYTSKHANEEESGTHSVGCECRFHL